MRRIISATLVAMGVGVFCAGCSSSPSTQGRGKGRPGSGETTGALGLVDTALDGGADGDDSGEVQVNGSLSACPTWDTMTAAPDVLPSAPASGPGTTSMLTGHAAGPDPAALQCAWSVQAGQGSLMATSPTDDAGVTVATYACPTTPGTYTLTLACSDGPLPSGGMCPPSLTTGTVQVTCQ